ncbi:MAG: hypothetical protein L3J28_11045 [Candidatus Polarisedimenticolaceae bacterium]|nr:hypothetical protein [Candidatus Polarisedimenticolaceae bacterium]
MAGTIKVVDVELVRLRIHHRHQPQAVDVVALDGVGCIGLGNEIPPAS